MFWYLIIIPLVLGYLAQMFCKVGKDAGSSVKSRPPPILFAIVWPILYLMLGTSWMLALEEKISVLAIVLYSLLSLVLASWIIVYGCLNSKKVSAIILVLCLALAFACFSIGNKYNKLLLSPLIAWLIFATILQVNEN